MKNIEFISIANEHDEVVDSHIKDTPLQEGSMNIKLINPSAEYKDEVMAYKRKFAQDNESLAGGSFLEQIDTFEEWLQSVKDNSSLKTVHEGLSISTVFLAINENNKMVGIIDIRHILNDFLFNYGGHVGYSVLAEFRKQGIASKMLELVLIECKKLGINRALLICDKNNIASAKIIIKNGGVLENEVDFKEKTLQRYWIET